MSTRSRIAVETSSQRVVSIYCHSDGYIQGVGVTLKKHYNSQEKALELIKKGDISILNNTIETTKYYKDRGDEWHNIEPQWHKNHFGLMSALKGNVFIEYVYLFADGEWQVSALKEHKAETDSYFDYNAYHSKFIPLQSHFKDNKIRSYYGEE